MSCVPHRGLKLYCQESLEIAVLFCEKWDRANEHTQKAKTRPISLTSYPELLFQNIANKI